VKIEPTFNQLVENIQTAHHELVAQVGKAINISLTLRNWLIGYHIHEYELKGQDRADYGERLFSELARELNGISNCNRRQLYRYRRSYTFYPDIVGSLPPQFRNLPLLAVGKIVGTPSPLSPSEAINVVIKLSTTRFLMTALAKISHPSRRRK